ncbi:AAA family ATPase [Pseudonocardia sp. H11422]|uniref:AAA family ATPase n=1 Tax=Pseudonocardia sp. H11422 TaxID=2835866 RepID=UPI001BDBD18B|nr:AAA family ATPase [Pseudonocardia sp. H11422]
MSAEMNDLSAFRDLMRRQTQNQPWDADAAAAKLWDAADAAADAAKLDGSDLTAQAAAIGVTPAELAEVQARQAAQATSMQDWQDKAHQLWDSLGVLTRAQLADLPTVDPLIEDTLDRRSMAVLAGYWGTGKSFLALDWACCVATGQPWQGRQVHPAGPQTCRVLYIVGEGAYGVHERITAWETERKTPVQSLMVLPRAVNLLNHHDVYQVSQLVINECIDLVIVDTLSRCMPGADENSAKDMSTVVANLDGIKSARGQVSTDGDDMGGTCVLVVHHTGKDKTTIRGSSVLEGAADTVYQVEGDGQMMKVSRTKRKDGPREDEHHLAIRWVPGTDSAVIRNLSADRSAPTNQDRMLSAFVSAFASTGASKAELRGVLDMPPATFHRALSALVRDGKLCNSGTDKRPFYKLSPDLDLSA